ncbi:Stk1 family PASTA domain-containing Ser/Thr kinase [Paractinoplanes hotanensis]|uniref:PASTA domain-containing protein n=1 Tax=Paractinoplanes hotanensis TaxID=2906497 RepID=A0ABT0Y6X5_9ACTN|nr:Stk1 family PASTA domain-containing Ser/Thr kinase [Actinoplanes hotanensis]MCM4081774.1 PASTA domain-containing protein [Actinoplanes hotanensis]
MPDESDETRRFSPGDADDPPPEPEATPAGAEPADSDATPPAGRPTDPDPTRLGGTPADVDATQVGGTPADLDATQVGGTPADLDSTQVDGPPAEAMTVGRAAVPAPDDEDTLPGKGSRDDDTLDDARQVPTVQDEPTVVADRPGSTAILPPVNDDDWAPSRANPAWSGRAEVRSPLPGRGYPEVDWAAAAPQPQRDRWWMPIVVGIIALVLLAVLGWAVYLLVNTSGDEQTPAPSVTTSAAVTPTETVTTETSSPSPTPTTPSPEPSTTDPTSAEVIIPALRGLALSEAQAALRSTGLNYRLIYRQAPDVPAGTVIDSDPVEGQEVPPDTTVTLVIAAEATNTPTTPTGPTEDPDQGQN